jgi:outer membrane protein assembly factor BamB
MAEFSSKELWMRSRAIAIAVAAVMAAGAAIAAQGRGAAPAAARAAADWPTWRGPKRDGHSPDTGLLRQWPQGGPRMVLNARNLGRGFSSVAVTGGRIYTMGDRNGAQHLIALSDSDGRELWAVRVGPVWDDEYAGPRATPTVDDGMVYALGTEGDLIAVDANTGQERWRRSFVRDFGGRMMSGWKYAESPLVDGDRVVVTPGGRDAIIVALNKKTGQDIWRAKMGSFQSRGPEGAGYSGIVISNGGGVKQYIQLTGRGVISVRASDGWFMWGYGRVANDVANISTPIVSGDHVFASTGYGTGAALLKINRDGDRTNVSEVYFLDPGTFQNHHGNMVLVGSHIYGGHGHNRGIPIALDLASGKIAWGGDIRNAGQGSAAVSYADGHLYFRYQNGVMMLIEATPQGYREKGSFAIPNVNNPSWSHPVIIGGRLYLREQDNLYVYDVREN